VHLSPTEIGILYSKTQNIQNQEEILEISDKGSQELQSTSTPPSRGKWQQWGKRLIFMSHALKP